MQGRCGTYMSLSRVACSLGTEGGAARRSCDRCRYILGRSIVGWRRRGIELY